MEKKTEKKIPITDAIDGLTKLDNLFRPAIELLPILQGIAGVQGEANAAKGEALRAGAERDEAVRNLATVNRELVQAREILRTQAQEIRERAEGLERAKRDYEQQVPRMEGAIQDLRAQREEAEASVKAVRAELTHATQERDNTVREITDSMAQMEGYRDRVKAEVKELEDQLAALNKRAAKA